jgi:PKD repeat protein
LQPPTTPDQEPEPPEEVETLTPPPSTEEPQPLTASFSIDSTNGDTAPATFLFEADAQGGTEPYTYSWNFGDESSQGSGISIHHRYEQPGTYDVTLAVIDPTAPTPQDISVTRQVNVRPATGVVPQPTPPANETGLSPTINQTTTTLEPPTFPPGEPPQCISLEGIEYCLLPPNTQEPQGVVCFSAHFPNGSAGYYCPIIMALSPEGSGRKTFRK